MAVDPNNPIVRLCADGMQAEAEGRLDAAVTLFEQAWAEHSDDYEACIAAHYVARHQPTAEAELHWNRVALDAAAGVDTELVGAFLSSLHLNVGHSCEKLGDAESARQHLQAARQCLSAIPDGRYRDTVRQGIENALRRVSGV